MYEDLKEYKGVRIVRKTHKISNPKANGSYSSIRNAIILYDRFFELNPIIQKSILEHEYGHYIRSKMPMLYRKIWDLLSNGKLTKLLYVMGLVDITKNSYVTAYAKTKTTEDWSECIETDYLLKNYPKYKGVKLKPFATFKMKVAVSMYNYFSKKELGK